MGYHCLRCLALGVSHTFAKALSAASLTNSWILCVCVHRQDFAERHLFNVGIPIPESAFESSKGVCPRLISELSRLRWVRAPSFRFKGGPLTVARCSSSLLCISGRRARLVCILRRVMPRSLL